MFRRSRLSIRPNVSTTGRTSCPPQESPSLNKDSANANTQETPVSVIDTKPADPPNEPTPGDSNDQHGEGASSSAVQRRKRFSVKPKVVPGRPSALPRTPKSPIKPVLPPVKSPPPVTDKAATSTEANSTVPHRDVSSPKESRLSKTDIVPPAEGSSQDQPDDAGKIQSCSQVKETTPKAPVPPSIPDRETIEISEKAKTLVSKTDLTTPSQQFSLTQLLNDKSDLVRLEKARKLRQLLKEEMLKAKSKKFKARVKEYNLDPSKMTMRDLIHYLPTSNPMSSTEESQLENETIIPLSPGREASPERAQEPEEQPTVVSPVQAESPAAASASGAQQDEEEEAAEEEEDDDALMVPQVKVAEDGTLIIDEESLTVEVQRMKGPNTIQDRDPIFERGSTTTYSSFRKGTHTKPWSTEETDMFFLAISMVGTDFTMICQLFPHRARSEIKNKFKKEERHNAWRIDKAFRERRKLDLEYFKKLLEKILEFQQTKKKLKSISEKDKTPRKRKRATKGKKATLILSDVEEEAEDQMSNEEQEGEKENLCNDKKSSPKPKRKRKDKEHLSPESEANKKKRKRENVPDSEEAALPDELCESTETPESTCSTTRTEAKPGKALQPLGRKGQKAPKSKAVVSDKGESTSEETVEDQINKASCPSPKTIERLSDHDSSDQEVTVPSVKPTRSGRMSKPVETLNYPAKEDKNSASDTSLTSPARQTSAAKAKGKTSGKRGKSAQQQSVKESKKPKLITLRASQLEDSDDEEDGPEETYFDSTSAFVPASLCSPKPVVPEVEETMEEDVIDFLSEHTETSEDEGYNEAAQTLLAIGNLANLSQPTDSQASTSDHTSIIESSQCSEVHDASKSSLQPDECDEATSQPSTAEVSQTEQLPTSQLPDTQPITSSQESCITVQNSPARKERFPKIKPKPNLGSRTSRLRTPTVAAAAFETKPVELETPPASQSQSSEPLESTQPMSESSQTESCDLQETDVCQKVPPKLTTPLETATRTSTIRDEKPSIIQCDLRTSKDTAEDVLEKTSDDGDIARTSQLRSLEDQEKPTLSISEQSSTKNETSIPALQTSDTQVVQSSDKSCSSQESSTDFQIDPPSAKNPPLPRKGRLSRIKPKPNIACASRTVSSKPGVTIESEVAGTNKPQSTALSVSESSTCKNQESESDMILETSQSQNQTEPGSERLPETQLDHLQEKCGSSLVQSKEKPQEQPKPTTITSTESENLHSTQSDHSSEEGKSPSTRPLQQSHPSSETAKAATPQRRRWIPKVKPNLILSPRTPKAKMESNEKSHVTDKVEKISAVAATSEQQGSQENISTKPHEDKSANVEPSPASLVSSKLDISKETQQCQPNQSSSTDQKTMEHDQQMECAPFETSETTEHQPQNSTLQNTETSEITSPPGPSSEIHTNEAAAFMPSDSGNAQDTSVQNTFECQHLFASMLPDQVPSDPDEPFFILSLTEIPVCPSGEVRNPGSCLPPPFMEAQQRDPVEPVVPPAGQIDISLSNIYIPTPEKAALNASPICVEEYLPTAPSNDISILAAAQENPEVRRLNLPEVQSKSNDPSTESQTPVRGAVDTKTKSRRQNLSCKVAAVEANTSQDQGETSAQKNIKSQKESDDSSVTSKTKKSAETKGNKPLKSKAKTFSKPPRGQNNSQTEEQPAEATVNKASSSLQENTTITIDVSQQDGKKANVKGKANRKNTAVKEAKVDSSIQQGKSVAVKSPEASELLVSHQSDSIESSFLEEEPTNVSEYFLSDVFTQVEGDDCPLFEKSNDDTACTVETQSRAAEMTRDKGHDRPIKALIELPDVFVTKEASSSVKTSDPNQVDDKKTRGRRHSLKKDKASCESLKSQRRCRAVLKSPDVVSMDTMKEMPSTSSSLQPQEQRKKAAKVPVSESNSTESNVLDEERTSVSQHLLTDAFTEVQSGNTLTGKSSKNDACTEKTSETKGKTRQKRKTITSSSQENPLTEEPPPEAPKTVKSADLHKSDTEKIKAKEQQKNRNKSSVGAKAGGSQPQRKRTAAVKTPDTPEPAAPERSDAKEKSDDELTSVSQCFVDDTFTEVESGSSAAGKSRKDDVCTENTQTSETKGKTRQRKTKASSGPSRSQQKNKEPPPEAQSTVKSSNLSRAGTGKSRAEELLKNRDKKPCAGAKARESERQRQSTSALKSPESAPTEKIGENPPSRSTVEQTELPDAKDSSDEEPTNVSQYFLSDIFTQVDEEFKS